MAENKINEEKKQQAEEPATPSRPSKNGKKNFRLMGVFAVLDRNQLVHAMPFILFITLLIIFYIGNSYNAESTIRRIDKMKMELKDKRAEFISTKSDVMFRSKPSEVAKAVEQMQIKEPTEPAKRIVVLQEEK